MRTPKVLHEIRDAVHGFVRVSSEERKVLDSRPVQRLRSIHQLALTHLVYPGATHTRFEHSLGVMELASQVFDIVTQPLNVDPEVLDLLPQIAEEEVRSYWRRVVRMAALVHDAGHLPFSHAAEDALLPEGWNHERLTEQLIFSEEMAAIWNEITPPLRPEDVSKVALKRGRDGGPLTTWEALLAEIITGDSFGVDRIDYLLRDSHHSGVAYGKFDHLRLLDTLRITPPPASGPQDEESKERSIEPTIGIEEGGLKVAESLAIARYVIFSEVYFHPIRRIYDIHLMDFLSGWLDGGKFSTDIEAHLAMTDNEVLSAIRAACQDASTATNDAAKRIMERRHFRRVFQPDPLSLGTKRPDQPMDPVGAIYGGLAGEFGPQLVRKDRAAKEASGGDFPVIVFGDKVRSSLSRSTVLNSLPIPISEAIFVAPEILTEARTWLTANERRLFDEAIESEKELEAEE